MNLFGVRVNFARDLMLFILRQTSEKKMSIAYIYLLFYLAFEEQFGITAKIEAGKELHADFLLTADQRH